MFHRLFLFLALAASTVAVRAEDGYRLWLRYDRVEGRGRHPSGVSRHAYRTAIATLTVARKELESGLAGLLGTAPRVEILATTRDGPFPGGDEGYSLDAINRESVSIRPIAMWACSTACSTCSVACRRGSLSNTCRSPATRESPGAS